MKKFLVALIFALPLAAPAGASEKTEQASANTVVDTRCVECHARIAGGDASRLYTRADRRVTTSSQLSEQIHNCNSTLKDPLFPEEEAHLAAYLNSQYYHFRQ